MQQDFIKLKPLKPALAGYISKARSMLETDVFPDEDVVHDTRVLMKKARAVLRLIENQLNTEFSSKEKTALREVGRKMASWRENSVTWKTLKSLKKDHPDVFERLESNVTTIELLKKPEPSQELTEDILSGIRQIREILDKSGRRIRFEPMNSLDPQVLLKSLETSYLKVADRYVKARNKSKPANLHELRKKTKDFLYQLWFFRQLNPTVIKKLEGDLDFMTRNLGKYNDLAQFILSLNYDYDSDDNDPALDELAILIREKQDQYLLKVWPLAYKIFCPGQNLVNVLGYKLLVI